MELWLDQLHRMDPVVDREWPVPPEQENGSEKVESMGKWNYQAGIFRDHFPFTFWFDFNSDFIRIQRSIAFTDIIDEEIRATLLMRDMHVLKNPIRSVVTYRIGNECVGILFRIDA